MTRAAPRIPRSTGQHIRRPKLGQQRPQHLAFIRNLPCIACRCAPPCEPAHVRMSRADVGKKNAMGAKPESRYTVPLCHRCHIGDQHGKYGEAQFWARLGIDPIDLSLRLWSVTGDLALGLRAVERAWQSIDMHRRQMEAPNA